MEAKPLVVIVGPTASGKTNLAIKLAEKFDGEIICADSRTVYEGMDIGTAKPTHEERKQIPHWGLDLVKPDERFTAADFKHYALKKIEEIRGRGHQPLLVGGTGLYVDGVIYDYEFGQIADQTLRRKLEAMTLEELYEYCHKNSVSLPENDKNKRYVIRAIEQKGINLKRREKPTDNTIIVGIATDRDVLRERIRNRIEQLFEDGVVQEAKTLGKKYGWECEAMTGNIYPIIHKYVDGELSLREAKQKCITQDWRLAKRQLTWFKRNTYIKWSPHNRVFLDVASLLASEY